MSRIEDYGLIGNARTAALIGRDGSMDWLCLPRFDSPACFASLLGSRENGRWIITPSANVRHVSRRYRTNTNILETTFHTDGGRVSVIDFMPAPVHDQQIDVVRIVRGEAGCVSMSTELLFRFDYGLTVPWVRRQFDQLSAIAGPDEVVLRTEVPLQGEGYTTGGEFVVNAGQTTSFTLSWRPSHVRNLAYRDADELLNVTEAEQKRWSTGCATAGPWQDAVQRSLLTLKMLTYQPTGGIVAAPTTSLPEALGGVRNWDYRFCWIRDATFTLDALMKSGYTEEAQAWRDWLLRAAAGRPSELQIMYGVAGEKYLEEREVPWLNGFESSRPVRIGNAAYKQVQLDVYGELMDVLFTTDTFNLDADQNAWALQRELLDFLEGNWMHPDAGIWEFRGRCRHFTHSKVMAWVAFDRAVRSVERFGLPGPVERWRNIRNEIHMEVCRNGYDPQRNTFVQSYGSLELDASLLLIPQVGFLPARDPRVIGTVKAVQRELTSDGLVLRYKPESAEDGLADAEGAFLACSFWLADALALMGQITEAQELFEHLLSLRNDLGLLAEEYDPKHKRFLGNFPQAFSHVALINTARHLSKAPAVRELLAA
jgi:GH15 family glucan-1,4-alpha-glucosidase